MRIVASTHCCDPAAFFAAGQTESRKRRRVSASTLRLAAVGPAARFGHGSARRRQLSTAPDAQKEEGDVPVTLETHLAALRECQFDVATLHVHGNRGLIAAIK